MKAVKNLDVSARAYEYLNMEKARDIQRTAGNCAYGDNTAETKR